MLTLLRLPNLIFDAIEARAGFLIPTLARFTFASALLVFFWHSAGTKLDGVFTLSFGAYGQIFPRTLEAYGYDLSQFGFVHKLIGLAGAYAEYVLPALIVLGLMTRLAALGMIGFIAVMSWVDIFGHGLDADTIGALFDRDPYGLIADQRLFWLVILVTLVVKGAGPLSVDRLIGVK
ncbi:putative oxidoreductase [Rubricella aquisinus]|uniref:Putative oxidoreductase n=1 Tax=Rubricella aquisinus TaxID=2028108 RepID=A0A840WKZ2_9RHOB|nr:DoxX family membrane protein [Rubricella aquisinus]MBB5515729.1 putative oxidoreductase [Rubricella aquisinus]